MKLTKKIETEIWKIYDTWMQGYLNADVETYNYYFDEDYHFIGSTNNEEFLNKKDTTDFFRATGDQFAGLTNLRKETKTLEVFGEHVFLTHFFDAWFKNDNDWSYYGRFRFSSVMHKTKEGWRFIYQHFSMPDSKSEEGQTIGFDKVHLENQELREAIQRRTTELEQKNRELEVETALERIRSQAVAMKESTDLLDIVVTMRNEFIKLGHEAHYFWHMMWLPETYEKAMTSGDGSKIGFVMNLPRHIHGNIPQLAKWEKSKKPTVVYAMNVDEALDYVNKMITLGDFQNIDPQAPTEEDIKHIGGLTFIMARTTHGEIGYSLPGIVKNPPKEDIDILVKFAGAFDLAHQRFLDLQKAEKQARETQIELSLERIRSRVMAMQESSDLFDIVVTMRNEFLSLGHEADYFWHMKWTKDNYEMSMTAEDGGRLGMVITVPKFVHEQIKPLYKWEKSSSPYFVLALNGKDAWDYIEKMNTYGKYKLVDPHAPTEEDILHIGGLTFIIARTTHGEIGFSLAGKIDNPPKASIDILVRFASVFDLAYKRFEDLKKAEAQARETQIELALEKVRSRTMAMQHSDELQEASFLLDQQVRALGIKTWGCAFNIYGENESTEWFGNEAGILQTYTVPREGIFKDYYDKGLKGETLFIQEFSGEDCVTHYEYMSSLPVIGDVLKTLKKTNNGFPNYQIDHVVYFKYGYLLFITREHVPDSHDIFKRFAKVFEQTYTRFLDLKKAEAQTREAQIETALERVRSRSISMHKSEELAQVVLLLDEELIGLGIEVHGTQILTNFDNPEKDVTVWFGMKGQDYLERFHVPYFDNPIRKNFHSAWKKGVDFYTEQYSKTDKNKFFRLVFKNSDFQKTTKERQKFIYDSQGLTRASVLSKNSILIFQRYNLSEFLDEEVAIFKRFGKVFEQAYTRFLDLQKAEAQAREAQIEMALEKVRSRTMAMQNSNELPEAANNLFLQVQELGIPAWSAGYCIWEEEDKKSAWCNMSSEGEIQKGFSLPTIGEGYNFEKPLKNKEPFHVAELGGEKLVKHYDFMKTLPIVGEVLEDFSKKGIELPTFQIFHIVYFTHGYLMFITYEAVPNEWEVFKRFGKVFQQTFTRFLDLQKAEAQTRTAQINLAVERVRAKALAMHKSEDIIEVVAKLKDEVMALDIPDVVAATIFLNEGDDKVRMWDLSTLEKDNDGYQVPFDITFKLKKTDPNLYVKRVWENQEDYFLEVQEAKDLKRIVTWLRENNKVAIADEVEEYTKTSNLERLHHAVKKLNNGKLVIDLLSPPSDEMESILTKMAAAFDLAYKRFEDLKKAEAQTREAQIEAALEKVRSRSLAMHKPDELQEVVAVVAEKLKELGVIFDAGGVILCTYFPDNKDVVHWITVEDFSTSGRYFVPYFDNPIFSEAWDSKNRGDAFFSKEFSVKAKNDFFKHAFENSDYCKMPDDYKQFVLQADSHNLSAAWSENSAIIIPSLTGAVPSESNAEIIKRFAKVFEQAYIRFMDLQKAEAQTRESQIEAALERVRSRSMAMHKSEEMLEVIEVVAKQLLQLNLKFETVSFGKNNQEGDFKFWIASKGQPKPMLIQVPFLNSPVLNSVKEAQKKGINFIEDVFNAEENKEWSEHLIKFSELKNLPQEAKDFILNAPGFARSSFLLKSIDLYVGNYRAIPFTKEENAIFSRFAHVFEQAYTRFLDLKKSEAQAREAQIEASLERVRSRTLAMQTSDELAETSVIVFKQLLELGIAPNRLFIGIVKSDNDTIEAWTTNEDGSKLAVHFSPQASKNKSIKKMLDGWKQQKKSLIIDMKGKELESYFRYLNEDMKIPFIDGLKQKRRVQTIAYFSGGLIGMAAAEEQPDDTIHLLERFAAVFNLTYTRFKDLKIAEANAEKAEQDLVKLQAAKKSAEEALSELQLTQNQLIQSEKMASLGELTAGIAHEIQNPLNFVNNFSEVSKELLDEMLEEIENGDMEEVRVIMDDVIQNLEKINHHGKRADGIVKGMLQHSRASGDKKEPTDINILADEYLRLAYHGLRAKDKSFNATLETNYDDSIENINIIPQDIGRVVLNLLTNAFYVVNERKQASQNGYEPTVVLSTKKYGNKVTISVKDNGNGIPKKVMDKIFQPFFTTKPTGQGTGLGLSMSYDIITKGHGGELEVETKQGKGTEFIIKLPI